MEKDLEDMKIDPKHLQEFVAGRDAEDSIVEEEESVNLALQTLTTSVRRLSESPRSQPSPSADTSRTLDALLQRVNETTRRSVRISEQYRHSQRQDSANVKFNAANKLSPNPTPQNCNRGGDNLTMSHGALASVPMNNYFTEPDLDTSADAVAAGGWQMKLLLKNVWNQHRPALVVSLLLLALWGVPLLLLSFFLVSQLLVFWFFIICIPLLISSVAKDYFFRICSIYCVLA